MVASISRMVVRPFSTALQFIIRGQPPFLRLWRPPFSLLWASRVSRVEDIFIHEKNNRFFYRICMYVNSEMKSPDKILKFDDLNNMDVITKNKLELEKKLKLMGA